MAEINLSCPYCGFSKDVDRAQIPANVASIKCPSCKESFPFRYPAGAESEPEQDRSMQGSSADNTLPSQEPPVGTAGQAPASDFKYCSTCGHRIHVLAEVCPKCGVHVAPSPNAVNKGALLLITFFLGGFGGHKFYQKKYLAGALYLLFFWTYIPTLIALAEFFIYAFKSESDLQQTYPESSGGAVAFVIAIPVFIAIIGILAAIAIPQFVTYREKAFNAAAYNDLKNCRTRAEAYYDRYSSYPTVAGQLQCPVSKDVALYYLPLGADEYQIVSFHDRGRKAYLVDSARPEIIDQPREEIEQEVDASFGPAALERTFHFIE